MRSLTEARSKAEDRLGFSLPDKDFDEVLAYSRQKLANNGKGEGYLPVLLETEITDFVMRKAINMMGEVKKCAVSAI